MKRKIAFLLAILMIFASTLAIFGCKNKKNDSCTHADENSDGICDECNEKIGSESVKEEQNPTVYTVTFLSETGAVISTQSVAEGGLISRPEDPEKRGFIFTGWYFNGTAWDFEKNTVNSNVTLKAGWQLNEESEGLFDPETPMPY